MTENPNLYPDSSPSRPKPNPGREIPREEFLASLSEIDRNRVMDLSDYIVKAFEYKLRGLGVEIMVIANLLTNSIKDDELPPKFIELFILDNVPLVYEIGSKFFYQEIYFNMALFALIEDLGMYTGIEPKEIPASKYYTGDRDETYLYDFKQGLPITVANMPRAHPTIKNYLDTQRRLGYKYCILSGDHLKDSDEQKETPFEEFISDEIALNEVEEYEFSEDAEETPPPFDDDENYVPF